MYKELTIAVLVAALVVMLAASLTAARAPAEKMSFRAQLTGDQVVPPVTTPASGDAMFRLSEDGKTLRYKLAVTRLEDPSLAHIHLAAAGENGPPVVVLFDASQERDPITGEFSGTLARGAITADKFVGPLARKPMRNLVKQIRAGKAYVNVHTKAYPDGEIRGQIE